MAILAKAEIEQIAKVRCYRYENVFIEGELLLDVCKN